MCVIAVGVGFCVEPSDLHWEALRCRFLRRVGCGSGSGRRLQGSGRYVEYLELSEVQQQYTLLTYLDPIPLLIPAASLFNQPHV